MPCEDGIIAGIIRNYERSVNCLECGAEHQSMSEADALREERFVETVKPTVNGAKEPKEKALSLAVAQIERQFGKGAIMRLGAEPAALDIAVIRPAPFRLMWPWGSAASHTAASPRSSAPRPQEKRRLHRCRARPRPGL